MGKAPLAQPPHQKPGQRRDQDELEEDELLELPPSFGPR